MKVFQYYAFNALGFFMFYLGFVNKHEWAMNIFLFVTWLSILTGIAALSKTARRADIPQADMIEALNLAIKYVKFGTDLSVIDELGYPKPEL
jgi:hypothetical protein